MFKKNILKTINKYNLIEENDKIVVGVSGGADSICLLHFLNKMKSELKIEIFAVHINHCMRGEEAEEDTRFVQKFCQNLNINLDIFYYNIEEEAKKLNMSFEEAGRYFRYKSFNETLKKYKANKIAVAHNKNDNVETFFMRLFRGSGIKGLAGIPFKRDEIIRPLLNCTRDLIEEYCEKNNIIFRNDSTNFKDIYTRNKIRLNLIPNIQKEFNSNLIETISNTINTFNEENIFLENLAKKYFLECLTEKRENFISLNIELLKKYDIAIKKRILRLAISNFNNELYNISSEHINFILSILEKQSGKMLNMPKNINIKIIYNNLCLFLEEKSQDFCYYLPEDEIIFIKEIKKYVVLTKKKNNNFFYSKVYTISFRYDKIKDKLIIRTRKPGDVILLNGMHKKIKNLFIDLKIPSLNRNKIPILCENEKIIAIPEFFVSDNYKILNNEKDIIYLHIWEENDE